MKYDEMLGWFLKDLEGQKVLVNFNNEIMEKEEFQNVVKDLEKFYKSKNIEDTIEYHNRSMILKRYGIDENNLFYLWNDPVYQKKEFNKEKSFTFNCCLCNKKTNKTTNTHYYKLDILPAGFIMSKPLRYCTEDCVQTHYLNYLNDFLRDRGQTKYFFKRKRIMKRHLTLL